MSTTSWRRHAKPCAAHEDAVTMPTLLVRADASPTIGTGHVMRQIALAQAWRKAGGRAVFAMHAPPESIAKRLSDDRFELHGIEGGPDAAAAAARRLAAQFVVLDGYQFGVDYHRALRSAG